MSVPRKVPRLQVQVTTRTFSAKSRDRVHGPTMLSSYHDHDRDPTFHSRCPIPAYRCTTSPFRLVTPGVPSCHVS